MSDDDALHARTQDAYSFDRYGAEAWMNAIRLLAEVGYDEEDIECFCYLHGLPYGYFKDVDFLPHSCTVVSMEALEGQYED